MHSADYPFERAPADRFNDAVTLLAAGIVRMACRNLGDLPANEEFSDSDASPLDVSAETVLSVTNG